MFLNDLNSLLRRIEIQTVSIRKPVTMSHETYGNIVDFLDGKSVTELDYEIDDNSRCLLIDYKNNINHHF